MKHLRFLARAHQRVLPACSLACSLSLAGCARYDAEDPDTSIGAATGAGGSSSAGAAGGGNAGSAGTAGGGMGGSDTGSGGAGMGSGVRPEPPDASCDNVTGCGGEVLGNWFAVDSCLNVGGMADLSALGIGCSVATAGGELAVTGNWTFADNPSADNDEILTDTTQTTGQILLGLGPECLNVSGTIVSCADVAGPLASIGFESSTCVVSTTIEGGCDCTGVVNQQGTAGFVTFDAGAMGLWSTEESTLTVAGFTTVDYGYCIEEDAFLHVSIASSNPNGVVTGTIVFQKQP